MITPLPFQADDAAWLSNNQRAALLSETGTGKSVVCATALTLLAIKLNRRINVLVMGPKSVQMVWDDLISRRQYRKYLDHYEYINYDKLVKVPTAQALATKCKWDCIIMDESDQCILRMTAKRCKNFFKFFSDTDTIWVSTGTPADKSAFDYYPMFKLMQPEKFSSAGAFGDEFCNLRWNVFKKEFEYHGFKNKDKLSQLFKEFARRRLKKVVLPELPDKFYTKVPCIVSKDVISKCLSVNESEIIECIENNEEMPGHLATIVRAMGLAKIDATIDWIKTSGSYSKQNPIVIFAWSKDVVRQLQERLHSSEFPTCELTGDTPQSVRAAYVADFQANKYGAIVLNMAAGGSGITLTAASTAVYIEIPWSARHYLQSQDRIHRIGTKSNVNIVHMVAANTIDEIIYRVVRNKVKGVKESSDI